MNFINIQDIRINLDQVQAYYRNKSSDSSLNKVIYFIIGGQQLPIEFDSEEDTNHALNYLDNCEFLPTQYIRR